MINRGMGRSTSTNKDKWLYDYYPMAHYDEATINEKRDKFYKKVKEKDSYGLEHLKEQIEY